MRVGSKFLWIDGRSGAARSLCGNIVIAWVAEWEPGVLAELAPILQSRRDAILARTQRHQESLRASFQELAVLEYRRTFDECLGILKNTLASTALD
jgi:hypothetical protein